MRRVLGVKRGKRVSVVKERRCVTVLRKEEREEDEESCESGEKMKERRCDRIWKMFYSARRRGD